MRGQPVGSILCTLSALLLAMAPSPAGAAEARSRAELIAQRQKDKAQILEAERPNKAERILERVQRLPFFSPEPRGIYPVFGGLVPGAGWFQPGVGYRKTFGDSGGAWDMSGRVSNKKFWRVDSNLTIPKLAHGRLSTALRFLWLDAPSLNYWGIGNDSSADQRTKYGLRPVVLGARGSARLAGDLWLGARLSYEFLDSDGSSGGTDPSIEEIFPPEETPGLGVDVEYVHWDLFLDYDWRQSPGYNRRGGQYRFTWHDYATQSGGDFGFRKWEASATQYIPLMNEHLVLALRGLVTGTEVDDDAQIPFYMLPTLGGGQELRSFPDYRFRDRYRMLLNVEYRWRVNEMVDMALFYDTGKVAAERVDLNFDDLHDSYGIGIRLHMPAVTALRFDVAHGIEGWRFNFTAGPPFEIRLGGW